MEVLSIVGEEATVSVAMRSPGMFRNVALALTGYTPPEPEEVKA